MPSVNIDWSKEFSYRTCTGGSGVSITVDAQLSDTSTNPVQNKVINKEVNTLKDTLNSCLVGITQADYDALSDEQKNNGTFYFVIDA